ncbi:MAG: arginine--tRNA ligase [Raineya sp.]|jgi:arginyl-tRNA synthetase|nr:arginine--tRNA ligase [Raineya sp.]
MSHIEKTLIEHIEKAFEVIFNKNFSNIALQETKKEFEGSHTLVVFPYTKELGQKPADIAQKIGEYLVQNCPIVEKFNAVQGFLNLSIKAEVWIQFFDTLLKENTKVTKNQKVVVEYSSPNTNKPLHLGHLRNNFLGYSVAQILEEAGYEVHKTQIINDRGIHICKSMLAYEKFGNGETPESSGLKGDHLVGKYYVEFDKAMKSEIKTKLYFDIVELLKSENYNKASAFSLFQKYLLNKNDNNKFDSLVNSILELSDKIKDFRNKNYISYTADLKELLKEEKEKEKIQQIKNLQNLETQKEELLSEFEEGLKNETFVMKEAQKMLLDWESGDEKTVALWKKMNSWVYEGFDDTYKKIGVSFDSKYYESNTYLLGKDIVEEGLQKGVFYKKEDGSVWIDLTEDGLDNKLVLRSDGTSVYITQDLGTAELRFKDQQMQKMVYVVGNEQDYHFKVLFLILKKLGRSYAEGLHHLSYGMVELPSGKMKSREGTVVDADDLVKEVIELAKEKSIEKLKAFGTFELLTDEEKEHLYEIIGLGALKYFLLKIDPQKKMLYNPDESVSFEGDAAPFIQYNHARICSVLRKGSEIEKADWQNGYKTLHPLELSLINLLSQYNKTIELAAEKHAPYILTQYIYELCKNYSSFWSECSIIKAESLEATNFRLVLSKEVAQTIKKGMLLLGIDVPERM